MTCTKTHNSRTCVCFQDFDIKIKISEILRDGSPPFFGAHLFQFVQLFAQLLPWLVLVFSNLDYQPKTPRPSLRVPKGPQRLHGPNKEQDRICEKRKCKDMTLRNYEIEQKIQLCLT